MLSPKASLLHAGYISAACAMQADMTALQIHEIVMIFVQMAMIAYQKLSVQQSGDNQQRPCNKVHHHMPLLPIALLESERTAWLAGAAPATTCITFQAR